MKNAPTTATGLRKSFFSSLIVLLCLGTFSCTQDDALDQLEATSVEEAKAKNLPDEIVFTEPALFPEGVSYDARNNRFLVTSLTTGDIGTVSLDGQYTPFITDSRLISTIGIEIDEPRKRILVAVSDPGANQEQSSPATVGQTAKLGIYDLNSGRLIRLVDLGALRPGQPHFANDIAVDNQGNVYVTDSFSPIIYKVDRSGNASVFFEDEAFATPQGSFGFNGIAYSSEGFLLVAFSYGNQIVKIPVRDSEAYSTVTLDASLMGPDGLLLSKNGKQLIVVNNAGGSAAGVVYSFTSRDKWASGTLEDSFQTGAVFPTTATGYGKEVFVLYAYLNQLFSGANPTKADYTIKRMPFSDNNTF